MGEVGAGVGQGVEQGWGREWSRGGAGVGQGSELLQLQKPLGAVCRQYTAVLQASRGSEGM